MQEDIIKHITGELLKFCKTNEVDNKDCVIFIHPNTADYVFGHSNVVLIGTEIKRNSFMPLSEFCIIRKMPIYFPESLSLDSYSPYRSYN